MQDSNEITKKKKKAVENSINLPYDHEASLRVNSKLVEENTLLKHLIDEIRSNQGGPLRQNGNREGQGNDSEIDTFANCPGAPIQNSANPNFELEPPSDKENSSKLHSVLHTPEFDLPNVPFTPTNVFAASGTSNGQKLVPPTLSQAAGTHMGSSAFLGSLSAQHLVATKVKAGVEKTYHNKAYTHTVATSGHMGLGSLSVNHGDAVESTTLAQGRVESAPLNPQATTTCSAGEVSSHTVGPISGSANTSTPAQDGAGSDTLKPKSWASLIAPKAANDFSLSYIKPREGLDRKIVSMPKEVRIEGSFAWKNTLVGYFIGKKLPFSYVKNGTARLWSKLGLRDMVATDSGFYFFKFDSEEESLSILEGGPWHLAGQPIILQKWHAGLTLSREAITTIPVWVHIYNIPLEYWNPTGLSHIASAIGKPLHVARVTANCRRISFARICIELNAKHELLREIVIEFEDPISGDMEQILLPVEYQWTPVRCAKCSRFGHDCSNLPKAHVTAKVDKASNQEAKEGDWQEKSKKITASTSLSGRSPHMKASNSGLVTMIAPSKGNSEMDASSSMIKDKGKNVLEHKSKAAAQCISDSMMVIGESSHTPHNATEAENLPKRNKAPLASNSTFSNDSSEHIVHVINPEIIQGPTHLQNLNPGFTNDNAFSALIDEAAVTSGPLLNTTNSAIKDDKLVDKEEGEINELEMEIQPSKPDSDTCHAQLGQQQDAGSSPSTSHKSNCKETNHQSKKNKKR